MKGVIATEPQTLGIARTQVATMVTRLGRRLVRAAFLTETPRDVTFVGLDIVGFGKRDSSEQARLRRRLFSAVKVIKHGLGNLISYDVLDRGDGVLLLLPGATDTVRILSEAVPGLANRVGAENRAKDGEKMILRCVIHKGQAQRDRWGWVGDDVNLVFRLLDSRTLKLRLLRGDHRSPVTVALSEALYRDACARIEDEQELQNCIKSNWHEALMMHTFRAKEVEQHAWVASVGVAGSETSTAP
jgi:class 3 adenylate cyclase